MVAVEDANGSVVVEVLQVRGGPVEIHEPCGYEEVEGGIEDFDVRQEEERGEGIN